MSAEADAPEPNSTPTRLRETTDLDNLPRLGLSATASPDKQAYPASDAIRIRPGDVIEWGHDTVRMYVLETRVKQVIGWIITGQSVGYRALDGDQIEEMAADETYHFAVYDDPFDRRGT